MDKIWFICGKGGSGKDTILSKLHEEYCLPILPTYSNRTPRLSEVSIQYRADEEIFGMYGDDCELRMYIHKEGRVLYCTSRKDVQDGYDHLACGPSDMYQKFLKLFQDKEIIPIVVEVSRENRLKRMADREVKEAIRRVDADDREWIDAFRNEVVIDGNREFEEVYKDVSKVLRGCYTFR